MSNPRAAWAFALGVALAPVAAFATETDQFTLPPKPLDDLGRDMATVVLTALHEGVAQLNADLLERRLRNPQADLETRDERKLATYIYQEVGIGMPEAKIERILRYDKFDGRNVRFEPSYWDTIYVGAFSPYPLAHLTTDCPTIRLYGVYMGTDKPGHIFQTGYEYYTTVEDALASGKSEAEAVAKAVAYGVMTEKTYYGIALTGVYSNGDLAGNYAGYKFFRNLFHEVRIGDTTLAPIIKRDGDKYVTDPARDNPDLMQPYISEHLNEAYNPSYQAFTIEKIRGHVRERCAAWKSRDPDFNEASYRAHLEHSKTWFGEP